MTTLSLMTNFYSESDKSRNVSSKGENKHQPNRIAMGQKRSPRHSEIRVEFVETLQIFD